jgi:gliding motility-associated-like protein
VLINFKKSQSTNLMKKRALGLCIAVMCTLTAHAQLGCPDVNAGADVVLPCGTNCANLTATYFNTGGTGAYTVTSIPYTPYSYTSGSTYLNGIDDEWGSVLTLPFNFCFFGTTYNQLVIGSNGIITFDLSVANSYNAWPLTSGGPIPTTNFQTNSIMGPYEDIDPAVGGNIYYNTLGVAPCRTFVISFTNVPEYSCNNLIATSQIVLYETTNVIEVNIQNKPLCSSWNGGLAIEGIQDATGTIAYPVTGRNNTQWTATNDSYRFTPSGTSIVSVNWSQGSTSLGTITGNATQAYTINVCPGNGAVTPYVATATYTRCDGTTVVKTDTVNVLRSNSAGPPLSEPCVPSLPGGTVTMAASGTGGAWTTQAGNPGTATITSPTSPTTTITSFSDTGTYHFIWTIVGGACIDTATVTVTEAPTVSPTVADITCTNAIGVINPNAASGMPPYTYIWSSGSTTDSINTITAGVLYTVTVTDNNLCTATATDSVANQIIIVGLTDNIREVSCYGYNDGQIALNVTPPGTYTYTWSNGDNTDTITHLPPATNYSVTVTDPQGCSATGGPYTITSPSQDSLSITPPDSTMALGDTIQLWSTLTGIYPATSYSWTPTYGLSCDTCPDPLFIPVDPDTVRTVYTLTATYYNGCTVSASDTLLARTYNLVAIPDAFSPNGDGVNDIFYIPAWSVREFHITIYNRWGVKVFETDDIHAGWDGTYRGAPQPSEVYPFFFTVSHFDGKTESHEGTVTLFR